MTESEQIDRFLRASRFAVVGASANRAKFGNKVLRCYQHYGLDAVPIHPRAQVIEGLTAYPDLRSVPGGVQAVSFITPPPITERSVEEALSLGIQNLWMQPGADSERAVALARQAQASVIYGGACLLVILPRRASPA